MDHKADILKMLGDQLQFHETEIQKIKNAILAYKGEVEKIEKVATVTTQQRNVKWTAEIEKIFETKNNLTVNEVKQALIKNGIEQAKDARGRSSIMTTLTRMVDRKKTLIFNNGRFSKPATLTPNQGGTDDETS